MASMAMKILPRSFYSRPATAVAPDLLGKILCRRKGEVLTSGRIVEVEAYLGADDPASHAYRGPTPRNRSMFGPAGHAYVYFTYGNHYCLNVVTDREGIASAVLIRALEPVEGIEIMRRRRGRAAGTDLMSGPGKLTRALSIDRKNDGSDLTRGPLWICDDRRSEVRWVRTPRIGIRRAADRLYRFHVLDSLYLSRRPSVRRHQGAAAARRRSAAGERSR